MERPEIHCTYSSRTISVLGSAVHFSRRETRAVRDIGSAFWFAVLRRIYYTRGRIGITNPLTLIEQLTYLMFIRSLDEKELEIGEKEF